MADGSSFSGIAALTLDEPAIADLARHAVAIGIERGRINLRIVRITRADAEHDAAEIVRDYLDQSPRGIRRANRQRGRRRDPAVVLTAAGLAAALGNQYRSARRLVTRHRRIDGPRLAAAIERGEIVIVDDDDAAAAALEVVDPHGDPLMWLCAGLDRIEAEAEANEDAEWRAAAPPAPRPRIPRPILHLRCAGGAS